MTEETDTASKREARLPGRLGPAIMLAGAVLTVAVVFLPWARLEVGDPNLMIRDGWYSGWELIVPIFLVAMMLIPLVVSVLMLAGKRTGRLVLEIGLCSFACGMEFLLLCVLLGMGLFIQDLATRVDLFKVLLGPGFWIAIFLLAVNVAAVVLVGYGGRAAVTDLAGEST